MALTLNEVAVILCCNYMTVYRMVKSGQLKAFRVGSDYRVTKENLDAHMAGE